MFTEYLFVYGTLRRAAQHPMHQSMLRFAEFMADGHVAGQLYCVGSYPALILKTPSVNVKGELYRVLDAEKLWPLLDQYEGIGQGFAEPYEYRKAQISVTTVEGEHYLATAYLYNRSVTDLRLLPHGDFLADS